MNRDPSLKATPSSRTSTTGVASSDGDCITHGYSNDRPSGVCDIDLLALNVYTDSLLAQVISPMGYINIHTLMMNDPRSVDDEFFMKNGLEGR